AGMYNAFACLVACGRRRVWDLRVEWRGVRQGQRRAGGGASGAGGGARAGEGFGRDQGPHGPVRGEPHNHPPRPRRAGASGPFAEAAGARYRAAVEPVRQQRALQAQDVHGGEGGAREGRARRGPARRLGGPRRIHDGARGGEAVAGEEPRHRHHQLRDGDERATRGEGDRPDHARRRVPSRPRSLRRRRLRGLPLRRPRRRRPDVHLRRLRLLRPAPGPGDHARQTRHDGRRQTPHPPRRPHQVRQGGPPPPRPPPRLRPRDSRRQSRRRPATRTPRKRNSLQSSLAV
ncbi:MAG: hypothetical protein AVDCRST_MAG02-2403, partial [uncultured Rubrobacteraceae bacterium]